MQRVPSASSEQLDQKTDTIVPSSSFSSSHHGLLQHELSGNLRVQPTEPTNRSRCASPSSARHERRESLDEVNADQLDNRLRRLSLQVEHGAVNRRPAAGQRVSDYENALTPPSTWQALGFKVVRRSGSSAGIQLTDFPNEILTLVLSHLHPDSHAAVALVSKRLYALVTTPHAWRMAFMRHFPGHTCLDSKSANRADLWAETRSDVVRSDVRHFARLTALATWRSEYLLRTRLLRSLARGKPEANAGGIGSAGGAPAKPTKSRSAVLTYNSKLPWLVTSVHAVFSNGKKPPRAVQGAGNVGMATMSDPTTGRIEKWGLEDPFSSAQLQEVVPNLVPYGLGQGPAAAPNVMDVSQPYGIIAGEGFPGGRAYFRAVNESCGRYLGSDTGAVDGYPDVPKIPAMSESVCSVWIAKSSAVPAVTQSMFGMLTGSALGVVTAYANGGEQPNGPRYANGDMTARWVLSPGVPIISLKVDDNYSPKRKSSSRVWAVALNALGEVYYLTSTPLVTLNRGNGDQVARNAWLAGRTAYWHLVESTRRRPRPDELDKRDVRGAYTPPRSPSNDMHLSKDQLVAEAREIEKFLLHKPCHFRKVCEGWDMRRRIEVDFASDDGQGAGESIFVIDCGLADKSPARVLRYSRFNAAPHTQQQQQQRQTNGSPSPEADVATFAESRPSLFGPAESPLAIDCQTPQPPLPPTRLPPPTLPAGLAAGVASSPHEWGCTVFDLKGFQPAANVTASCLDCSSQSLLTLSEDALEGAKVSPPGTVAATSTPVAASPGGKSEQVAAEVPGRRARFLVIGTDTGVVTVWNAREQPRHGSVEPVRILQTVSPGISCVAASALYLVHGGSDGLAQAWDPLASTLEPIRTLNARSNGRVPRHMVAMNPTLGQGSYSAVGAIFLDPDATVLRGILSFGALMRYWTYSSAGHPTGRKRRARHSDIHGRIASRRLGGTVSGYIAAEEAELRRENEARAREQTHLRKRFGLGALGDLSEEEALRYAQMVSEEAYLQEEQRRAASDSAADSSLDTASSLGEETATAESESPDRSVVVNAGPSPAAANPRREKDEYGDFEQQILQAIRLSLLEAVNEVGPSPRANNAGELDYSIKVECKRGRRGKPSASPGRLPASTNRTAMDGSAAAGSMAQAPPAAATAEDEHLALALSLSKQDQAVGAKGGAGADVTVEEDDEFPPLATEAAGKGKRAQRW